MIYLHAGVIRPQWVNIQSGRDRYYLSDPLNSLVPVDMAVALIVLYLKQIVVTEIFCTKRKNTSMINWIDVNQVP